MFDIKEVEKLYPGAGGLMIEPQKEEFNWQRKKIELDSNMVD